MKKGGIDELQAQENFQLFLFEMDDRIELLQRNAQMLSYSLDLSLASLEPLERYLQAAIQMPETARGMDRETLIVTTARYLGELMRLVYGGKWQLSLSDPKNIHYNKPVIVGHTPDETEFSPLGVARAFILKPRTGLFLRAVTAAVKPRALDLSDLIEP